MCDEQPTQGGPLLPYYFCSQIDCDYPAWKPASVSSWRPYTSQPRRMVNSLNESVLSLRPWSKGEWSSTQIIESLKGAMHPIGAFHAAAADMVVVDPEIRIDELE